MHVKEEMKMKKLFVLFVAAAMVVAFTVPVTAADWGFYGSARMKTFWEDRELDGPHGTDLGDDGLTHTIQGNSRIGANVKADAITGQFEYGTGVNLRILAGKWNFGAGELEVGQDYTPATMFIGNQVYGDDLGLLDMGGFYAGRQPMIQLGVAGFKVALVRPTGARLAGDKSGDVDNSLPKIEARYDFKADKFSIGVFGGYNSFDVENSAEAPDYSVDSYVAGVAANFNFGPAYVKVGGTYGQNTADYGASTVGADGAQLVNHRVEDTTTLAYAGAVGFKVSDMLAFEGGIGRVNNQTDVAGQSDDDAMVYYIQASVSPAKGFFLVPEIGIYDYQDNRAGADEGKLTYFGVKTQINF